VIKANPVALVAMDWHDFIARRRRGGGASGSGADYPVIELSPIQLTVGAILRSIAQQPSC